MAPLLIGMMMALPLGAPASAGSDGCAAAQGALLAAWREAGHELTPEVARAIQERLDACPAPASSMAAGGGGGEAKVYARVPLARECGYSGLATASHPSAPITTWYTGVNEPDRDQGAATATYAPSADETTYHVLGQKWGFDASSTGVATIYLYGAPIPAEGSAAAGCRPVGVRDLCWATATARLVLPEIGGITLQSSFTNC